MNGYDWSFDDHSEPVYEDDHYDSYWHGYDDHDIHHDEVVRYNGHDFRFIQD